MADLRDASNFCARYSVVGLIFMSMVWTLLTYEPFYIGGIEDYEQATSNAFGAAKTFLAVFILSVIYLVFDALTGEDKNNPRLATRRSFGHEYDAVPMSGIGGPDLMFDNMSNLELPPSVEQAQFT
mmetsp:Transcript_32316/g.75992  ORF Transcript_32316/g.75992 Transcript_32316/m.75992 type:complete len:126 (-) Transcript_32316:107-484(-)